MEKRQLSDLNCVFFKECPPSVMDVMCRFGLGIPLSSAESALLQCVCCTYLYFSTWLLCFVFSKMNLIVQTLVFLFIMKGIPALTQTAPFITTVDFADKYDCEFLEY